MAREPSVVSEFLRIETADCPTESEIASVAYQLWVDHGCLVGSDQADWFEAEALLTRALAAQSKALSISRSTQRRAARTETLRWEGHWEVWEREWGGARWVWD
jgi:hypothetical protein